MSHPRAKVSVAVQTEAIRDSRDLIHSGVVAANLASDSQDWVLSDFDFSKNFLEQYGDP